MDADVIIGINYPWGVVNGQANYGCDFGVNMWHSHTGVSTHTVDVRADFDVMGGMGVEVVRWFVFTDGRGGVDWNGEELAGLSPGFFDDMDAALECATTAGVRLCLVLIDYAWAHEEHRQRWLNTAAGLSAFLERLIDPILARYDPSGDRASLGQAIHSFDVINEPDWVTAGLEADPTRLALSLAGLREFIRATADRIHARSQALVTVGGGRVRFAPVWDDPDLGLDFVQVHAYPDVRYPERDDSVFGRAAADFGLSRPLLIGEHACNPRLHPVDHLPPASLLEDYLALALEGGYLGAWPWSFKGTDAFGAVDPDVMRHWVAAHKTTS